MRGTLAGLRRVLSVEWHAGVVTCTVRATVCAFNKGSAYIGETTAANRLGQQQARAGLEGCRFEGWAPHGAHASARRSEQRAVDAAASSRLLSLCADAQRRSRRLVLCD